MIVTNETHDTSLTCWVDSANSTDTDFPIQNLPFASFRVSGNAGKFRGGVAIGDQVIDLSVVAEKEILSGLAHTAASACSESVLNEFMALGKDSWSALRLALSRALRTGAAEQTLLGECLLPQSTVEYQVPAQIGDYTDFYTSLFHATNVGKQFRPDNPLLPNYKWLPIGYHGRSSSIEISGHAFKRPKGQLKAPDSETPAVGACRRLDYEMELGIYIGSGNDSGTSIDLNNTDDHVFGLCLFNDWSARDIQAWEYQPLGPFLAKNFASTVSPWIVTLEALAPYRCTWNRNLEDPQPLPYLESELNRQQGSIDIQLEVSLATEKMLNEGEAAAKLSHTSFRHSYWTVAQMIAHHTINGCNLRPGDFIGSGTQSGPNEGELGSMLELSKGGKSPLQLPNGELRSFLEDGDLVTMSGFCQAEGAARIGFGSVNAVILPA
ncbi:MAG: fumarylacetoacetase [Parasphingorhabdus sp.]|jgi:fumarylacetoacetase